MSDFELKSIYKSGSVEAGCDEAGRGCLAGPVYAAAVIFPEDYRNDALNDSKKLTEKQRLILRSEIENDAVAWAVGVVGNETIDKVNILNASILAMHSALNQLDLVPNHIIIDGNRFKKFGKIPHVCVVKGDSKYLSIAAASILAKTYRDEFMIKASKEYPQYQWQRNKGYPTKVHRKAVADHGITPLHRKSFNLSLQLEIPFGD